MCSPSVLGSLGAVWMHFQRRGQGATHGTASVYINDAEDGLIHDYDMWLEKLAPHEPTSQYQHNRTGEDNADAHLKRQVMGREVVVPSRKADWTLARGSGFSTERLAVAAASVCW